MTTVKHATTILLTLALLAAALPAGATMVTNVTTGTTLLEDDFEGLGTAVSHTTYPDSSGDYDPVASIGSWSVTEGAAGTEVQVTDSTTSPDPGAYQGSNYLRCMRSEWSPVFGNFSTVQSTAGNTLHFEWMMHVTPTTDKAPGVNLVDSGDGLLTHVLFHVDGDVTSRDSEGDTSTGLTYPIGEWFKLEMDYTVGDSAFDLAINGTTAADIPLWNQSQDVAAVRIFGNTDANTYIDAVPEPGTVALMVMGAAGLLFVRRRR